MKIKNKTTIKTVTLLGRIISVESYVKLIKKLLEKHLRELNYSIKYNEEYTLNFLSSGFAKVILAKCDQSDVLIITGNKLTALININGSTYEIYKIIK